MRPWLVALLGALALLLLPGPAAAQDPDDAGDDVVVLVGPVTIAEPVAGSVVVFAGGVRLDAPVGGDVVVFSGDARLTSRARVGGDVRWGETRPVVASGARVGGRVARLDVEEPFGEGLGLLGAFLFWLAVSASTLVLGLVLLVLARRRAEAVAEAVRARLGAVVAWGLALAIGLPILGIVLLVTLLGIPLGIAVLLALFPLFLTGYVAGCWAVGRRILGPPRIALVAFLAGWALLRALALVPVLGGIAAAAATIVGLGALVVAARRAG